MSSGFSYPQPIFKSSIYNPAFYLSLDASGYLTYDYAQTLYLDKNDYRLTYITGITPGTATQGVAVVPGTNNDIGGVGAFSCSSLTVGGSAVVSSPDYVLSITPGLAAASKALVLDGNRDITNINSLTATTLTGTLQTGSQTSITAIGNLTSLSLNGNLTFSGAGRTITGLSSISATTITGAVSGSQTGITSVGTLSALTIAGNLVFTGASRTITGLSSISATTLTGAVSGSQTGITSVGTLTNLTLSTGGTGLFIPNLKFYNSTTTLYDNFNHAYYVGVSEGGCVAQKALVVDLNKDIGSIRNLNAVSVNGSTQVSGTIGDFGTFKCSGTTVISSSRHIQNIGNIACSGVANAFGGFEVNSVAFVNASRDVSARTISTTGDITCSGVINGFLAYGNQDNIESVGTLIELSIGAGTIDEEYLRIQGSGMDFLDGSYTRMCRFVGSNLTPVEFQIEVHNGTRTTGSNATWIGNKTNNDLRFGVNDGTQMILTSTGRVGIGTTTPSAPLHVPNSNTYTFGAGSSTVYRLRTNNGITESALGPIFYDVSCILGGYLACQALATTSDRRLKRNMQPAPLDRIKILYDQCEVKLYDWIESENRPGQEVGLVAQDLVSAHLTDLTSVFYRDDIEEGEDPSLEPANAQLNIDYSRISAYNMRMIQHLMSEIEDLKSELNELRAIISE